MTDSEKLEAALDLSLVLLDSTKTLMDIVQILTTIVSCKDPQTLFKLMEVFNIISVNKKALDDVTNYLKEIKLIDS